MNSIQKYSCFFILFVFSNCYADPTHNLLLQKGWAALVKDNENEAFRYFWMANEKANKENNTADKAESLLYLGICSFGSSLEKGLQFATKSLDEFKKLESSNPNQSKIGRSKCLQLISTIYSRQNKIKDAIKMSQEVVRILKNKSDSSGTLGLAYISLGSLNEIEKRKDSVEIYYQLALKDFEEHKNLAYLPNAYLKIGKIAQHKNQKEISLLNFNKGLHTATISENKQAKVSCLLAIGKWYSDMDHNNSKAENYYMQAYQIAQTLSDKIFEIKALESLIDIKKQQGNFREVSEMQSQLLKIQNNFYSLERAQIVKSLEVQFDVAEKNRQLAFISKEKKVTQLTNSLLFIGIFVLIIIFGILYYFLKKINNRDKILLKTKEEMVAILEQQKVFKAHQFQKDIEHKESQLSAITLQMLQKNELLSDIKTNIEKSEPIGERQLLKMVNKHLNQDNSWNDFETYFEGINKNFYTRLKQNYPEISTNDLKICALIKLNLSSKEMATILNISPDSVKTARYRLRKKLQLQTEENLTDFILTI